MGPFEWAPLQVGVLVALMASTILLLLQVARITFGLENENVWRYLDLDLVRAFREVEGQPHAAFSVFLIMVFQVVMFLVTVVGIPFLFSRLVFKGLKTAGNEAQVQVTFPVLKFDAPYFGTYADIGITNCRQRSSSCDGAEQRTVFQASKTPIMTANSYGWPLYGTFKTQPAEANGNGIIHLPYLCNSAPLGNVQTYLSLWHIKDDLCLIDLEAFAKVKSPFNYTGNLTLTSTSGRNVLILIDGAVVVKLYPYSSASWNLTDGVEHLDGEPDFAGKCYGIEHNKTNDGNCIVGPTEGGTCFVCRSQEYGVVAAGFISLSTLNATSKTISASTFTMASSSYTVPGSPSPLVTGANKDEVFSVFLALYIDKPVDSSELGGEHLYVPSVAFFTILCVLPAVMFLSVICLYHKSRERESA